MRLSSVEQTVGARGLFQTTADVHLRAKPTAAMPREAGVYAAVILGRVLGGCLELRANIPELLGAQITDGAQIEIFFGPKLDIDPLQGRELGATPGLIAALRDEDIDDMVVTFVDQGGDGFPQDIVDPPSDQIEALRRQASGRWWRG